jgi:alpha-L-rhamnosidase
VGHVSFNASVDVLNKIQKAVQYTLLSNIHSHPEDCPQRERHGWMADSQVASAPANLNFDMSAFYTNWVRTMHDEQLLGCDVPEEVDPLRATVSADAIIKGLPSPEGLPPRPPWFSCNSRFAPTGNATGAVSDVVPWGGWPGGFPADPNWGVAVVTVPWEVYKRTGRLEIVQDHYEASKMFLEFLDRNAANKSAVCPRCAESAPLYTIASTADWLCCDILPKCGDESFDGRCNKNCPGEAASAFAHVLATLRMVDMSNATGHADDHAHYVARLALLRQAYHERFFVPEKGRYEERGRSNWVQSHQVFPLYLGVVPADAVRGVVAALVADIKNQSNHINCGIIGSRFILEVLTRFGHADLALTLATEPSCPSWGYMIESQPGPNNTSHDTPGTVWESWQDLHTVGVSKNHPALSGGIGLWLYQLAGLAEEGVPHSGLVFRPPRETLQQVGSAELRLETPEGEVGLSWRYVESQGLLGLLRDEYSREFEVNVSLPFQLPHPTLLHIPIPSSPGKEGEETAGGATSTSTVLLRERGCDCVIWSSDERLMEPGKVAGLVSVKLALSPLAWWMKSTPDTVVVKLMGGDWGFHVGIPA